MLRLSRPSAVPVPRQWLQPLTVVGVGVIRPRNLPTVASILRTARGSQRQQQQQQHYYHHQRSCRLVAAHRRIPIQTCRMYSWDDKNLLYRDASRSFYSCCCKTSHELEAIDSHENSLRISLASTHVNLRTVCFFSTNPVAAEEPATTTAADGGSSTSGACASSSAPKLTPADLDQEEKQPDVEEVREFAAAERQAEDEDDLVLPAHAPRDFEDPRHPGKFMYQRVWRAPAPAKMNRRDKQQQFESTSNSNSNNSSADAIAKARTGWKKPPTTANASADAATAAVGASSKVPQSNYDYWTHRVVDHADNLSSLLERIEQKSAQPTSANEEDAWPGGRMPSRQLGVLHADPAIDMQLLTQNYTLPAVASALREREDALQHASQLAADGNFAELQHFLRIFHPKYILERRRSKLTAGAAGAGGGDGSSTARSVVNLIESLDSVALEVLRKALMRMPRSVVSAHSKRAAVVIPLCTVSNKPSLLLEKRSPNLRAHPDEVCLPGGMVCEMADKTIVNTCLREMKEEIQGLEHVDVQVLGVFRCNWGEVQHLVGVAVTPVVCFLGELPETLIPNPSEVAEVFTVPLTHLVDKKVWVHKEGLAPIFMGGPHVTWGLTGYILDRFCKDILAPHSTLLPEKERSTEAHIRFPDDNGGASEDGIRTVPVEASSNSSGSSGAANRGDGKRSPKKCLQQ